MTNISSKQKQLLLIRAIFSRNTSKKLKTSTNNKSEHRYIAVSPLQYKHYKLFFSAKNRRLLFDGIFLSSSVAVMHWRELNISQFLSADKKVPRLNSRNGVGETCRYITKAMKTSGARNCFIPWYQHAHHAFVVHFIIIIIITIINIVIKDIYIAQVRKGHKCAMSAEMAVWLRNCICLYSSGGARRKK